MSAHFKKIMTTNPYGHQVTTWAKEGFTIIQSDRGDQIIVDPRGFESRADTMPVARSIVNHELGE